MNIFRFKYIIILFVLIFLFTPQAHATTTIFSDSFNNDYGELSTHTPTTVGTSWTQLVNNGVSLYVQSYNNHVTVQSNTANGGSIYVAEGTYPSADYEISADALFAAGDSNYTRSLILRAQDSNNMYLLRSSNTTMTIYKRVSGTWTSLGSGGSVGLSDNTVSPYYIATLTFSAIGSTLTGKVNGVTKVTVTDSSITSTGKAGIGLGYTAVSTDDGGTGVGMDTVLVQTTSSDSTAPTITNISSDKTNGSYTVGEVIDIDVTFSEAVTSTGNVTVTLETGDTDRTCTFSVSSATTGTCNYTVQAGDTSTDLTVSSISGTIADAASNAMSSFVPATNLAANKALVIDTTNPTLQSLAPSDNETNFSPVSSFLMIFNEVVDIETGNITIKKTSDDSTVETISVSGGLVTGTGTTTITIDPATNLSDLTQYYILVDATAFDDVAGNSYEGISSTTAWSFTTADITAPTITNISSDKNNGSYGIGEVIDIDVTFSEAVTSTGNVTVTLETGDTDRTCTFSVSSSATGTCNYTVQAGDTTSDLTVNTISGTIADQASNAMSNFVPSTNLAANKALVINTTAPVITLVGSSSVSSNQGVSYSDAGATATDDIEGDLTSSIVTSGSVNVNTPGTYIITYNVSDGSNNAATAVTRTVTVISSGGSASVALLQAMSDRLRAEETQKQVETTCKADHLFSTVTGLRCTKYEGNTQDTNTNKTFTFTKNLKYGFIDDEVKLLQEYLNNNGYTVSKIGPGSKGNETTMFGVATRSALIRFQKENNITPPVGYFGTVTRGVMQGIN